MMRLRSRILGLLLTAARVAAASLFHQSTDVQMRSTCIDHGDKCWEEMLELCPRGNNKDVIIIILVHDNVYIPC
jgi:hypothetical protein